MHARSKSANVPARPLRCVYLLLQLVVILVSDILGQRLHNLMLLALDQSQHRFESCSSILSVGLEKTS